MRPRPFMSALLLLCAASAQTLAQPCEIPEQFRLGGVVRDAVAAGDYTFVATDSGIQIIPLSGPDASRQVGIIPLEGIRGLALRDGTLFACSAFDGSLHVIDVSQAPQFTLLGSEPIGSPVGFCDPFQVRVVGDLAAINDGCQAHLFDVSDPAAPDYLTGIPAPTALPINHMELTDGAAALISRRYLWTYDLTDPALPRPLTLMQLPTDASGTTQDDGLLYVTHGGALSVVDMRRPASPVTISHTPINSLLYDVEKVGPTLHVRGGSASMVRVDVSDPQAPFEIDVCCAEVTPWANGAIAATNNTVVIASALYTRVFDASGDAPEPTAASPRTSSVFVAAVDDQRVIGASALGLSTLMASPDGELIPHGLLPMFLDVYGPNHAAIIGDHALVTTGSGSPSRIGLFDISDFDSPTLISWFSLPNGATSRIETFDDLIFITSGVSVLVQRLLNDVIQPVGSFQAFDFAFDGEALYTLEGSEASQSLVKRSASDPLAPPLASTPIPSVGSDRWATLRIDGGRAYVLHRRQQAVAALDISGASPTLLGISTLPDDLHTAGAARRLFQVYNHVAYLVHSVYPQTGDLWAIDLSNPASAAPLARRVIPDSDEVEPRTLVLTPTGVLLGQKSLFHFSFVACPCPGDLDGDGVVDFADLNLVIAAFNTTPSDPDHNPAADTNGDNVIDFADLNVILAAFNEPC